MSEQPNVLLFFTDQQRFDTIHALNNPVIRTPSLDRIAREGVAFTSAYSASPVCISARCSMIHGQYPMHTDCYENTPMPTDGRQSFMGALTDAGYRTHGIGKCHFSPDSHALRGFESRESQEEICRPEDDDYGRYVEEQGLGRVWEPMGVRGEMYYVPQVSLMPAEHHPTQWVGNRSVAFVEEQAGKDQPWMLFSSYIHPHPPFAPPCPWHKLYRAPMMPLPKVPQDVEALHTFINRRQNRYKYRDQGIDQNLMRNMRAHYFACISFIDYQVGRVLDALQRTGQLDNTLILYTADHGEHLGDYNCFGKRSFHDTCSRLPMLARLPGRFEGGRTCTAPVNLVDIAPTVLGATTNDTGRMQPLDGVDMKDILEGTSSRTAVHSQWSKAGTAIHTTVTERWKYAYSAADDREYLFDRVQDPAETRNRAGCVFCRDTLNALRTQTIDFLRSGDETVGIENNNWRRYPRQEISTDPDNGLLIQDRPGYSTPDLPGYTD